MILGTEKMSGDGKRSDEETLALAQRIESIERTYQDYLALKRDLCDKLKHWWQVRNEAYRMGPEFFVPQGYMQEEINVEVKNLMLYVIKMIQKLREEMNCARLVANSSVRVPGPPRDAESHSEYKKEDVPQRK